METRLKDNKFCSNTFSDECCQQRAKCVNGNLPLHWINNTMAATKNTNCAQDHRPEPMELTSKVSWIEI